MEQERPPVYIFDISVFGGIDIPFPQLQKLNWTASARMLRLLPHRLRGFSDSMPSGAKRLVRYPITESNRRLPAVTEHT